MKILCTGDLHIGRRPSRLPDGADAAHACSAIWPRIVDLAIGERVDLVALSGDLVDQRNRYFEAVGPLEAGLRQLTDAGIPAVAVAGNHDHDVLPRLVDAIGAEHLRLLGRGGQWERATFERPGGTVHVDGWSFPREHVDRNPLLDYQQGAMDGVPVLGLLHAELGSAGSRYAPVSLADFRGTAASCWLLGHVHAPAQHDAGGVPVLYPGSPQAMDPGEPGWHGVWMLELAPGAPASLRRVPLSSVRYEPVTVELREPDDEPDVEQRVHAAVGDLLDRMVSCDDHRPEWLCCRVVVAGRVDSIASVEARLAPLTGMPSIVQRHGVTAIVESVRLELGPRLDLEELARGSDAPAMLARLLRSLDAGTLDAKQERLLRASCGRVAEVSQLRAYRDLAPPDAHARDEAGRALLRRQATRLLETLLGARRSV